MLEKGSGSTYVRNAARRAVAGMLKLLTPLTPRACFSNRNRGLSAISLSFMVG